MSLLRRIAPRLALGAACTLGACSGPQPAPPLAVFRHDADPQHYFGSALSGPRPSSEKIAPFEIEAAWSIEVEWRSLRSIPEDGTQPIGTASRVVLRGQEGQAIQTTAVPEHLRRARIVFRTDLISLERELIVHAGAAPEPGRIVRAALPAGTTAAFEISWELSERLGLPKEEQLAIIVSRPADASLETTDLAIRTTGSSSREIVVLDAGPLVGGPHAVLLLPVPLGSDVGAGIAVRVAITPAPDAASAFREQHHRAFADALADFERARKGREYWSHALVPEPDRSLQRDASLGLSSKGLTETDTAFLLARTLGAALAADLVIELDEKAQQELRAQIRIGFAELQSKTSDIELAWVLERKGIEYLLDAALRGPLPRPLKTVVARHLGMVALNLSSIEELLGSCRCLADFQGFVLAYNREGLEDSSLEARSLSLTWLRSRQLAPPGYDPLAPGDQRREQLARARAEGWR